MPAKSKKLNPIRGWDVVLTRDPIGRPIVRAINPDGGPRDFIEASTDETEDGQRVSCEAVERAILWELVRQAPTNKKPAAQAELDAYTTQVAAARSARIRAMILEK